MADRPIIFSGPMVQALLAGRKTMTRRVLKPQPPERPEPNCHPSHTPKHAAPYLDAYCGEPRTAANPRGMSRVWHWWQVDDRPGPPVCKVPCAPGDRLWVREAHKLRPLADHECVGYRADMMYRCGKPIPDGPHLWRPSIHTPRWASRLTLHVTDVRVQRLQEISEEDAIAEGGPPSHPSIDRVSRDFGYPDFSRSWFAQLWNSLHGPDAWDANPWVCAISFDVERANIDATNDMGTRCTARQRRGSDADAS